MAKFIAIAELNFQVTVDDVNISVKMTQGDTIISILNREFTIAVEADDIEMARVKIENIVLNITRWLSLAFKVKVSANVKYIEDELEHKHCNVHCATARAILLTARTFRLGIESLKVNLQNVLGISNEVAFALDYISLGINLLASSTDFGHRYAILEFARAVELVLGGKWQKEECADELLKRGYDHLVKDVYWLLELRGNCDVAHPSTTYSASWEQALRARDIAINLVLEETGYILG